MIPDHYCFHTKGVSCFIAVISHSSWIRAFSAQAADFAPITIGARHCVIPRTTPTRPPTPTPPVPQELTLLGTGGAAAPNLVRTDTDTEPPDPHSGTPGDSVILATF